MLANSCEGIIYEKFLDQTGIEPITMVLLNTRAFSTLAIYLINNGCFHCYSFYRLLRLGHNESIEINLSGLIKTVFVLIFINNWSNIVKHLWI